MTNQVMNAQLQGAHDALIQTPEFSAFLAAGGTVEALPLTVSVLRSRLSHIEAQAWLNDAPAKHTPVRNEDAYHEMNADRDLTNYK